MLETDLWTKLRKAMGAKWRGQRIEDSISSDIPDVFFTLRCSDRRVAGMMELKCQEPNKKLGINAKHYTQGQRDFAILHDNAVFLFLYSGGWYMMFGSDQANLILRGQSLDWHREVSLWSSQTLIGTNIASILCDQLLGTSSVPSTL
jgi:hypothetical protein